MIRTSRTSRRRSAPKELSIRAMIDEWAERTPAADAIAAPGRRPLTYSRLQAQVNESVATLNTLGIGRGDRVALLLPNGPEMAAAFLTVAACATAAPLNPACRAAELDFYLRLLKPKALLVQSGAVSPAAGAVKNRAIPVIELSPFEQAEAGVFTLHGDKCQTPALLNHPVGVEDTALILPTSGTTSRPKLVPLNHVNLNTSARNIQETLKLLSGDRCLNAMPLFHIHGLVGALLSTVASGGSILCPSGFDAGRFYSWLEEFKPTWYTAVPTIHEAILASGVDKAAPLRSSLRMIRSSSAALAPQLADRLEKFFAVPVVESYGMTEAAHQITSNPLPPRARKPGSVGVAAGPEVAVIDEAGNPLPAGSRGEIAIRGANVMQSYADESELNAGGFVRGWFRTGDEGYLDADGYLFITARLKEIINKGGEKISPREIDETLMEHPDIREAISFAVPHPSLGEDVAAAVVLREGSPTTEATIGGYLRGRVADFKVPGRILIVDEIPKGPTGKIVRSRLAERFADRIEGGFVPPRTNLEEAVAAIYAEVLNHPRVGADSNFFALGGDSLRAMQVLSRVRSLLQVNLSIATLFRKATVAELAAEIAESAEAMQSGIVAEILTEVRSLTEEDAKELVSGEPKRPPNSRAQS